MSTAINMEIVEELLSLSEDGDPELLVDLIQIYLDDGPTKLHEITEGLDTQDYDRVERAAHSLKGSAGNLGAVFVQQDCDDLQRASRQHSFAEVQTSVERLQSHYREAEVELQSLLARYS